MKILKNIAITVICFILITNHLFNPGRAGESKTTSEDVNKMFWGHAHTPSPVSHNSDLEKDFPDDTVVDGQYDNDVIFDAICAAVEAYEDRIIIYHFKRDIIENPWYRFQAASDFKYFWLENIRSNDYSDYSVVYFDYIADADSIEQMISEIDTVYRDIEYDLTALNADSSLEAAEYLYNYLVREVTYDQSLSGKNIRNIYGALVEKKAVCTGYAMAFDYIMSRLGYSVGIAGNPNHTWNYMDWNSSDHFVDVTWGDPDTYDKYNNHNIDFTYLALSADDLTYLDDHQIQYVYISGRGYDGSEIGYSEYCGSNNEYTNTSYCDHNGYNAGSYSYDGVKRILKSQYDLNENSLIVKFDNRDALHRAVNILIDDDCDVLNQIIYDIGYHDAYRYQWNDAGKTLVIYVR